ncbi:hypothetical protein O6H91_12G046400 [Diphasiastrum complanatum]|uniref:Uncharacterized protein n=1 Tax=Diphasiastrum complanatum TaxID=34168 RepID=A0ACC2C172_DIPCM|nr:hypothetical protein O6H91_12G046400 [Diphasiastrum complanatum]
MGGQGMRWRVGLVVVISVALAGIGITGFLKPLPNSCIMTYMYPTYIPVPGPPEVRSDKYGLYLYHEGWRKIDFQLHLRKLSGVPVLFIPGNGGSYKQVRSVAAESDRAFNGGPLEESFYQEASFTLEEAGIDTHGPGERGATNFQMGELLANTDVQGQYPNHLDWFAVDLEGEHSAMDGRILEEHTDYVVLAIHRILDQYKESFEARSKQIKETGEILPTSVILVGHSMGGFVARAAVVHSKLRAGAVKTILTLSSPHSLPPIALQPSLGHFFSRVNDAWRRGYRTSKTRSGRIKSSSKALLSDVVVVSIFGGIHDYQVRSRMASLDGIVPPTNGLTIGAPEMLNVWLSSEHQSILWCNQLVVQVAHTLLHLVDRTSAQPFASAQTRLALFVTKFRSALSQTFGWLPSMNSNELENVHRLPVEAEVGRGRKEEFFAHKILQAQDDDQLQEEAELAARHASSILLDVRDRQRNGQFFCQKSNKWEIDSQEKDLYINTPTVTVLAMDGRRRWLDIKKLAVNRKKHFILVTNLSPCSGVRVHLWPEKEKTQPNIDRAVSRRTLEVTTKMVQLPAGPAPRQIEPGGQTEQAPPSGLLLLSPKELHGFRFITISVAPRPTVSGRPPPATSMAVGQFFNPKDGSYKFDSSWLLSSVYKKRELSLSEEHPLVVNFSIPLSLGTVPLVLEVETSSCGISDSQMQQAGDKERAGFCKLRCFPPLALAWDPYAGLEIFPNLHNETIVLDSSPATWSSYGSEKSTILLLVDPHCAYTVSMEVSLLKAANRFILTYGLQIAGFTVAVILFALMRQARAAELNLPLPSVLACTEMNLIFPLPFTTLAVGPLLLFLLYVLTWEEPGPSFWSLVVVSLICYVFANGIVALLAIGTLLVFHSAASFQVFLKFRWQTWLEAYNSNAAHGFVSRLSTCSNLQIVRTVRGKPRVAVGVISSFLVFFVHPGVGLVILLCYHAWSCYISLYSYRHKKGMAAINKKKGSEEVQDPMMESSKGATLTERKCSYIDVQLELFKVQQGLLLLHFTAAAMLVPSLIAWAQRPAIDKNMPWFYDSIFAFGIIVHGLYEGHPDATISVLSLPIVSQLTSAGLSSIYGVAGLYCYFSGIVLSPYRSFYALAVVGFLTTSLRLKEKIRLKGDPTAKRWHFHKHS